MLPRLADKSNFDRQSLRKEYFREPFPVSCEESIAPEMVSRKAFRSLGFSSWFFEPCPRRRGKIKHTLAQSEGFIRSVVITHSYKFGWAVRHILTGFTGNLKVVSPAEQHDVISIGRLHRGSLRSAPILFTNAARC